MQRKLNLLDIVQIQNTINWCLSLKFVVSNAYAQIEAKIEQDSYRFGLPNCGGKFYCNWLASAEKLACKTKVTTFELS